jgi:hypothetical protein
MTDFVPYTPAEYAVDAPATALHFQRWFENWIAGFEGAAGAARLRIGALQRLTAGSQIRSRDDQLYSGVTTSFTFAFLQAGMVRCVGEHRWVSGGATVMNIIRTRNGAATTVATWSLAVATGFQSRTADVAVLPGDLLNIECICPTGSEVRNRRIQTNGEDLFPAGAYRVEGNTYA